SKTLKADSDAQASVPGTHNWLDKQAQPQARRHLRYLSAALLRQVQLRDKGRCRHVNKKGNRCESERWLEVHHILPVSKGGRNQLDNLITLCSTHHKLQHLSE